MEAVRGALFGSRLAAEHFGWAWDARPDSTILARAPLSRRQVSMAGEMQTTISLRKVFCGTELMIV